MARCYKYAIVRLAPDDARDERINIGAVIITDDGLDVRISHRLDKIRAISAGLDREILRELLGNLSELDARLRAAGISDEEVRLEAVSRVGPLSLSKAGTFTANDLSAYEDRIKTLLKAMVDPEPAPLKGKEKRSRLLTQIKSSFRQERVLAAKDEDLSSHRIVSAYELDEGLVADLVLRNGAMHVVETVDASGDEDSLRRAIADIGIAALVLERARMKFGEDLTKARLVYNASAVLERIARPSLEAAAHQGAELTNWASADERNRFIHSLTALAIPSEQKRRKLTRFGGPENNNLKLH